MGNQKYYLFMYDKYYPGGGMNDFMGSFDSIDEAKKVAENAEFAEIATTLPNGQLELILSYYKRRASVFGRDKGLPPGGWIDRSTLLEDDYAEDVEAGSV